MLTWQHQIGQKLLNYIMYFVVPDNFVSFLISFCMFLHVDFLNLIIHPFLCSINHQLDDFIKLVLFGDQLEHLVILCSLSTHGQDYLYPWTSLNIKAFWMNNPPTTKAKKAKEISVFAITMLQMIGFVEDSSDWPSNGMTQVAQS